MWNKLIEASAPCKPHVVSTLRNIIVYFDSSLLQCIGNLRSANVLLAATSQEEIVNLLVKLIRTGEDSIIVFVYVKPEDGTAKPTHL